MRIEILRVSGHDDEHLHGGLGQQSRVVAPMVRDHNDDGTELRSADSPALSALLLDTNGGREADRAGAQAAPIGGSQICEQQKLSSTRSIASFCVRAENFPIARAEAHLLSEYPPTTGLANLTNRNPVIRSGHHLVPTDWCVPNWTTAPSSCEHVVRRLAWLWN